ncbi:MAG TPA: MotA/TolQ/ExbB proton channel family protein [Gemmatimonadaceae bacterium]|nr:MotA/TolQ/ExbB proton channel family protein [Gemmatimonadaceae bacterium]
MTLALLQLQMSHGAVPSSPVDLILNATPVTQAVLLILAFLSLLSWSIMFGVWRSMKKAANSADKFWSEFEHISRLEDAATLAKKSKPSALPRLFMRAIRFVADARVANQQVLERVTTPVGGDAPVAATLSGSQIETLHLLLDTEASDERDRLGRFLPWLATIGSVSPLIGLLGTVLGVIEAFLGIATKGSGNLAAVAPGVGEALTATAAALAVAIPATFGYNIFAARLNRFAGRMERFSTAVIALLVREGRI